MLQIPTDKLDVSRRNPMRNLSTLFHRNLCRFCRMFCHWLRLKLSVWQLPKQWIATIWREWASDPMRWFPCYDRWCTTIIIDDSRTQIPMHEDDLYQDGRSFPFPTNDMCDNWQRIQKSILHVRLPISPWIKWPPFLYLQMHFLEWKL